MKNIMNLVVTGVLAVSMLGFTSCQKDDNDGKTPEQTNSVDNTTPNGGETPEQNDLVYQTLVGTEWEGRFATYGQEAGYTNIPITIHWTVDFLRDGKGEVMFYFESELFDNTPYTLDMTYNYDGNNAGTLKSEDLNDENLPFTIDPYNRTMNVELTVNLQHAENGPIFTYGGRTTLHQTR